MLRVLIISCLTLMPSDNIKMPDLSIDMPGKTFYQAAALEVKKRIRKRTETDKKDYQGKGFKKYSAKYGIYRSKSGRGVKPNLSFSGKMLGSMKVLASKITGKVVLSGEEAKKARGNEARGRIFFALHDKDRDAVMKLVTNWMGRKNKLKR